MKLAAITELRRVWIASTSILPLAMTVCTQLARAILFTACTVKCGSRFSCKCK